MAQRHDSCRRHRVKNPGAAMKDRSWHDADNHSTTGRLLGCCRLKAQQRQWWSGRSTLEQEHCSAGVMIYLGPDYLPLRSWNSRLCATAGRRKNRLSLFSGQHQMAIIKATRLIADRLRLDFCLLWMVDTAELVPGGFSKLWQFQFWTNQSNR